MDIPEILTWSETLSCYGMSQTGMHLMPFQKNPGSGYKVLCGSVHPEKRHLSKLSPPLVENLFVISLKGQIIDDDVDNYYYYVNFEGFNWIDV